MKNWQKVALRHANEQAPEESCGLVVSGAYWPCRNIHPSPKTDFLMSPDDYAAAEDSGGTVEAVVHSHPNGGCNPSVGDRAECRRGRLPWYIVGLPSEKWGHCTPDDKFEMPLEGRPFVHGTLDCYTLVQDSLEHYFGVRPPDFFRWDGWWNETDSPNLYRDNYESAGFLETTRGKDDLRPGDMLVMNLSSPPDRPNHAAIYLGDGEIIHHPPERPSEITTFGGYWYQIVRDIRRHKDLPDA